MKTQLLKASVVSAALALGWVGQAAAQIEPLHSADADPGSPSSVALASKAAEALTQGNAGQALHSAEEAIQLDPRNPWAYYDKADALSMLGQVDGAVAEFRKAEKHFSATDRWGRSIAIYGRANVLNQAGRCDEAAVAFREYRNFVATEDPASGDMAQRYALNCISTPVERR
jgi:Flp pilus assembly protein TadD